MHRFGQKFDHGLLSATWRWKIRAVRKEAVADFNAMNDQSWEEFDIELQKRLAERVEGSNRDEKKEEEEEETTETKLEKEYDWIKEKITETIKEKE